MLSRILCLSSRARRGDRRPWDKKQDQRSAFTQSNHFECNRFGVIQADTVLANSAEHHIGIATIAGTIVMAECRTMLSEAIRTPCRLLDPADSLPEA